MAHLEISLYHIVISGPETKRFQPVFNLCATHPYQSGVDDVQERAVEEDHQHTHGQGAVPHIHCQRHCMVALAALVQPETKRRAALAVTGHRVLACHARWS